MTDVFASTVNLDFVAPTIENRVPAPGAVDVPSSTSIMFDVIDDEGGSGVDPDSVDVLVDGQYAVLGGVQQPGFSVISLPITDGFKYTINPDFLPFDTTIEVQVSAQDFAEPPNVGGSVWSFSTADLSVVYVMRGWRASTSSHVTWTVLGAPDPAGNEAPVPAVELSDIIIVRVDYGEEAFVNRAWRAGSFSYIYWLTVGEADPTGELAPAPAAELSDFVSVRIEAEPFA
jgi:hypothetical protein